MVNKYYSLETEEREANLTIFGDITSFPFSENDVSAYQLSKALEDLDVDTIHVHINSYGGEVAEGWAIYNALKNHKAKVITYADGFACSIASVIFMAGESRVMRDVSLLMIHNPWAMMAGNADDLRKEADALEKMGDLSAKAYLEHVNISEEKLKELLDAETWITPEEAFSMGFSTETETSESGKHTQSARAALMKKLTAQEPASERVSEVSADDLREILNEMKQVVKQIAKGQRPDPEQPEAEPEEKPEEKPESRLFDFFKNL